MMSFHDFGHALHRYGILSFAHDATGGREEKDGQETKNSGAAAAAVRTMFENASRGNWPGDGKVSVHFRDCFPSALYSRRRNRASMGVGHHLVTWASKLAT